MINIIIFISLVVIAIFLNVLLNFRAKKAYKQNNFHSNKSRFYPLIIIMSISVIFFTVPKTIIKNVQYSSFESYMFWAEGRVGDKEPFGVETKTQIDGGYIYSFENHTLSGILIEKNGSFSQGTIKLIKSKTFENNNEMYSFNLYNINELDTNILVIHFFYDGNEITTNITINTNSANVYYNLDDKSSKYLLCKSDMLNFNISIDGENYIWKVE